MDTTSPKKIMRVYTSSTDRLRRTLLYEAIVYAAKRNGLAGATVVKGVMGYGSSSRISSHKFWEISEKLPVIVEIIDDADKIDRFFELMRPFLEKIGKGCLITIDPVTVVYQKPGIRK
jgi:hypothetical protein